MFSEDHLHLSQYSTLIASRGGPRMANLHGMLFGRPPRSYVTSHIAGGFSPTAALSVTPLSSNFPQSTYCSIYPTATHRHYPFSCTMYYVCELHLVSPPSVCVPK